MQNRVHFLAVSTSLATWQLNILGFHAGLVPLNVWITDDKGFQNEMTHLPCYYLLEKAGWLEAWYFLNDLKLAVQHISLRNTFNNIQTKQRHKSSVFRLIINNSHKGPWQMVTVSNFLRIIINNKTRSCSHCLLTNYYWKEKRTKFLHSFYISHLFFPGGREKKKQLYLACVNSSFWPNMIKFAV